MVLNLGKIGNGFNAGRCCCIPGGMTGRGITGAPDVRDGVERFTGAVEGLRNAAVIGSTPWAASGELMMF